MTSAESLFALLDSLGFNVRYAKQSDGVELVMISENGIWDSSPYFTFVDDKAKSMTCPERGIESVSEDC